MIIKKIMKENNESIDKIIQYFSNAQILELLKQSLVEIDYYKFIKSSVTEEINNDSFENYLENNVSKTKLLNLIKTYDVHLYEKIINEMITNLY